jgi:hypothetical protein
MQRKTLESEAFYNTLARTNAMQLSACQHWLEQVGCIHGSLSLSRTNYLHAIKLA